MIFGCVLFEGMPGSEKAFLKTEKISSRINKFLFLGGMNLLVAIKFWLIFTGEVRKLVLVLDLVFS